jgi:hypothetical protein
MMRLATEITEPHLALLRPVEQSTRGVTTLSELSFTDTEVSMTTVSASVRPKWQWR